MRLRDAKKLEPGDDVHVPHMRVAGKVDSIRVINEPRVKLMIKVTYKSRGKKGTMRSISFNYRLVELSK